MEVGKKMTTLRTPVQKLCSVSIREAHLRRCATDTNEHEKSQTSALSIEALRNIGRIVREIKARIDVNGGNQDSSAACTPDTGSGAAAGPMGGEDPYTAKKERR
jgi:hypothetical protein